MLHAVARGTDLFIDQETALHGRFVERAERTGDAGAEAVREVGVQLPLEPDHRDDRHQQAGERDDDLEDGDPDRVEVDVVE